MDEIEAAIFPSLYADVPSTFVTLLGKLAQSLPESMPAVLDPAGTGDNFTDRYGDEWDYNNFRTRIIAYASKGREAYKETNRETSIALWQDIFGDSFKPGALVDVNKLSPLSASVRWSAEQFIDEEPYNFRVAIDPTCSVRISGHCTGFASPNGTIKKGFQRFKLPSRGNRVPKRRCLLFKAMITGILSEYQVFWKVRNGGEEANKVSNGLRGEITKDAGEFQKTEPTLYRGTHYVECYVVRDGVVVAKDRQVVIVTT